MFISCYKVLIRDARLLGRSKCSKKVLDLLTYRTNRDLGEACPLGPAARGHPLAGGWVRDSQASRQKRVEQLPGFPITSAALPTFAVLPLKRNNRWFLGDVTHPSLPGKNCPESFHGPRRSATPAIDEIGFVGPNLRSARPLLGAYGGDHRFTHARQFLGGATLGGL
jgi:hypothetical protein